MRIVEKFRCFERVEENSNSLGEKRYSSPRPCFSFQICNAYIRALIVILKFAS